MRKTSILVGLGGLFIPISFYILRGNTMLKSILDWLGNAGVTVFLTLYIPLWITLIVYLWKKHPKVDKKMADLKIGAKVNSILTYGYYDRAEGGGAEGDKKVFVDLVLTPLRPEAISFLALELLGKKYEAKEISILPDRLPLFPLVFQETISRSVQVDVPKQFAINSKEARIFALANGAECRSEPFPINFGDQK